MPPSPVPPPQPSGERRISDLLETLFEGPAEETRSLNGLLARLHDRGFGLVILIFVLPNCLPMPGIPYVSTVTGIPICLFALQMAWGMDAPRLPRFTDRYGVRNGRLRGMWQRLAPWVGRLERLVRPRLPQLTHASAERLLAVVIFVLAVILALPIPAGNILPAWAIMLLALGLMERDGAAVLAGLAMTVLALAWTVLLLLAGKWLLAQAMAWWQSF